MTNIESIKQKILQLDPGSFQNLCDSYLYKVGYPNIVSLGGKAGTRKTTIGTPDTYFNTSDGRYIFLEYTTQIIGLFPKIKDDIAKCLDISKTGITYDKIVEIIYCHTSSNITPVQDNELRNLCNEVGIKLTIIGIDKLAEDIYLQHHIIARDFLGISISTNQIQSYDEFIKDYNSNKMAAPIDTKFLFREKEISSINDAFQKTDVVILSGQAGAGKTRLALEYCQTYAINHNEKLLCIQNKALPIYEDLKLFIDVPGDYFILIDDANQLSGLQHIIRYTTMKSEGFNVKILVTVRDYAIQKVIKNIHEISYFEVVNIDVFSDDEIKKLLEVELEITNSNYLERIARIAEGNARIAMLAGRLACDLNNLAAINDVSQLYEDYYGRYLDENSLLTDNALLITAGIVAFLEAIHLDRLDSFLPILEAKGMNRDGFIENIRKLHDKEIIDIYNDKAVRFSEQCLSNFLLKYIFFDKKLLSLSLMIKTFFKNHKDRTIMSINTLINIFRNKDLISFVEKEIRVIWNELSQEKSSDFFEFVKCFFRINPTETLLILDEKTQSEDTVIIESHNIDTEKDKNYKSISNDIIKILGGFADMDDLPTALDIFFKYYLKRPDLYMQFYHAVNSYFGIKKDSINYGYYTQVTFLKKLKEYSDEWKEESIVILFFEVAEEFLKLCFQPMEEGRKNTITIYTIPLIMSEGVEKYRGLLWEYLLELSKIDKYKGKLEKVLNSYDGYSEYRDISVLKFDLDYITSIMKAKFPASELKNCLLADKLRQVFSSIDDFSELTFVEYLEDSSFHLFSMLKGPDYNKEIDLKEIREIKEQKIKEYVLNADLSKFKKLIDVCYDYKETDGHTAWRVGQGLDIAFSSFSKKDNYVGAIRYYIEKNTPNNLYPHELIKTLFTILSDSEVYQLINSYEFNQKNEWLYVYFYQLPQEKITKEHLQSLYYFLSDSSDKTITTSSYRDISFLNKYIMIDKDAYIDSCRVILSKKEYSPFMMSIYFSSMFFDHHNTPQALVKRFRDDINLLEAIYIAMLEYNENHDYNGKYLTEIYSNCPTILDKYIFYLINVDRTFSLSNVERNRCFFKHENFIDIYDKIFDELVKGYQFPTMSVPYIIESILLLNKNDLDLLNKQETWIHHCIQIFSRDRIKMQCLFSVIAKLDVKEKIKYVLEFLKYNQDFEHFKNIPLTPMSWSWSGSAVPMYSKWIDFLKLLLPNLIGLKWIKHKNDVENKIKGLERRIEYEQIEEILRD